MSSSTLTPLTTPYYWLRIPTDLTLTFNQLRMNNTFSYRIDELLKVLTLDDVLYLVYEQTAEKEFNKVQMKTQVNNFTQVPENILWLHQHQDEVSRYLQKKQDEDRIRQAKLNTQKTTDEKSPIFIPFEQRYDIVTQSSKPYHGVLFMEQLTQVEESPTLEELEAKGKYLKKTLRDHYMDTLGYEHFRLSPLSRWTLSSNYSTRYAY